MSHIAVQETKPGEPMFADLEALQMACGMLGLEIVQKSDYTWFNQHMGDYPPPMGMKIEDLGHNAKFVIKLNAEKTKEYRSSPHQEPYEIGMIEDPNNPGCYTPLYDFFMGGYGLDRAIGTPLFNDAHQKSVKMLCPKLKQHYEMCADALAAKAAGDKVEFLTAMDAHTKYPQMFPSPTKDTDTWVSIIDTDNRVAATL